MSTTSPSQQGVEGTDAQEVWIITEESVILVISTSLFGKICILPQRRHILCLLATFQRLVAQFVGSTSGATRTNMAIASRNKPCCGISRACAPPSSLSAGPCWWLPCRTSWCWPVRWFKHCTCRGKRISVRPPLNRSAGPWPELLLPWAHPPPPPKHPGKRPAGPQAEARAPPPPLPRPKKP